MTTGVVFTCSHADPSVSNERFTWLGRFLYDLKPDFVWDLGDGADMRSLNSFDTTKPGNVVTQNYEDDIDTYNDAQERIRHYFKKSKRKRPAYFGMEGNHEHRIKRALEMDPRLQGNRLGISFGHLNTNKWFDEYYEYKNSAPAIATHMGVNYAHFLSGVRVQTAIAGIHHAYTLINKNFRSTTVGHSHKRSMFFKDEANAIGLVAGCFKGADEGWAGQANNEWWSGVIVKHNIEDGMYSPQFVSLRELKKEYGNASNS